MRKRNCIPTSDGVNSERLIERKDKLLWLGGVWSAEDKGLP